MTPDEKFWQLFMIPGDLDSSAYDYSQGVFGLQIGAVDSSAWAARSFAERVNASEREGQDETNQSAMHSATGKWVGKLTGGFNHALRFRN